MAVEYDYLVQKLNAKVDEQAEWTNEEWNRRNEA